MKNRCLHTLQLNRPFMIRVALIHCVTYSCDCCISAQQFTVTPQTCWFIGVNSCPSLHRRRSVTFDALLTTAADRPAAWHNDTHIACSLIQTILQAGRQAGLRVKALHCAMLLWAVAMWNRMAHIFAEFWGLDEIALRMRVQTMFAERSK